ncbi:MAG: HD domain-containing protein [Pseudonocardiaceae bacterium]
MDEFLVWAVELAGEKLEEALSRRWAHVLGVGRRAQIAAPLFSPDDGELLIGAALLHDVGYAPGLVDMGFHSLDGARYLQSVSAPDRLVHLVAHHSCAILEAELRTLSSELAEFNDERTVLRDALWWADMTTTPDGSETTAAERVVETQRRYGPDHLVSQFIRRAWNDLYAAVERTEMRLAAAGIVHK